MSDADIDRVHLFLPVPCTRHGEMLLCHLAVEVEAPLLQLLIGLQRQPHGGVCALLRGAQPALEGGVEPGHGFLEGPRVHPPRVAAVEADASRPVRLAPLLRHCQLHTLVASVGRGPVKSARGRILQLTPSPGDENMKI